MWQSMLGNKIFQRPTLVIGSFLKNYLKRSGDKQLPHFCVITVELLTNQYARNHSIILKNEVTYQRKISHVCNLGLPPCNRTEPWHHHTPQQRTCLLRSFPIRKPTWNQPVKLIKAENNWLIGVRGKCQLKILVFAAQKNLKEDISLFCRKECMSDLMRICIIL